MSMKKSNDTIGNRIGDLPACGAVPQPSAPPTECPYVIHTLPILPYFYPSLTNNHKKTFHTLARLPSSGTENNPSLWTA
jgi:hypothetical protein